MILPRVTKLGVLLAVAIGGPAIAHPEGPAAEARNVHKPPLQVDERTAVLESHKIARCLVQRRARAARELLAQPDPERAVNSTGRLMGLRSCYTSEFGTAYLEGRVQEVFAIHVFRGMVAEQLIRADTAHARNLPPLPRQQLYRRPWFDASQRDLSVNEMATCVSEVNPSGTLALVLSEPASAAERQAFAALAPVMGPCLRAGATLKADRPSLRAALAEALYQPTQP